MYSFQRSCLVDQTLHISSAECFHQADFVDGLHTLRGHTETHPLLLFLKPKALVLEVRIELPAGFDIRVRNVVSRDGLFSGDLTNSCHSV